MFYVVSSPNSNDYRILNEEKYSACKGINSTLHFMDKSYKECKEFVEFVGNRVRVKLSDLYKEEKKRLHEKATDFSMERDNEGNHKFNIDKYNGYVAGYKQATEDLLILS